MEKQFQNPKSKIQNKMLTPAMQQYMKIKSNYPDCIILFRMGDFYETFFEDAKLSSKILGIALTSRGGASSHVPLAGIPYHAVEPYIAKLIKSGHKVAICEQLEDPKFTKGIVKRDVIRVITPGSLMEEKLLDSRTNNYIISLSQENGKYGISAIDVSTGEFITTSIDTRRLITEVNRLSPSEIIMPASNANAEYLDIFKKHGIMINSVEDLAFWHDTASEVLKKHFEVLSLEGFGIDDKLCISSSGALLSYLKDIQKNNLSHITKIKKYHTEEFMYIDTITKRNLELITNIKDGIRHGALLEVLDKTITPMGSRLLKKWLLEPLTDIGKIKKRLNVVEELKESQLKSLELTGHLKFISDIERIISRIAFGSSNARDLIALRNSLKILPQIRELIINSKSELLKELSFLDYNESNVDLIDKAIRDDAPIPVKEGNIIKYGYNKELDEQHSIQRNAKQYITELESGERKKTGIKSLKISYNKVFGYFIEVTKSNLSLVPSHYIRKQTQVNSERFVTEELKEKEVIILTAEERIANLEYELFQEIVAEISRHTKEIQDTSNKIANLDCLLSFAKTAAENNYCNPEITNENAIIIKSGRHPVVECHGEHFVPNECVLDEKNKVLLITGPNMSGKSTFLRQTALICLMAQIGSFVPAESAKIGIVDRIFTRVGAYDDLAHGQSTFMVEMSETANILNSATEKSLIILDEIGRGTSTYDGMSLAWAIAEYIYKNIGAKTLFATHYHHLNKLAEYSPGIKNFNIAVHETGDEITFLHKIVHGSTNKSYGIHVAKLAGMPREVIERSKGIMNMIEMEDEIGEIIDKGFDSEKIKERITKIREKKEYKEKLRQISLLDI